jgi:acetolactate synthase I/II/III large subunit
VKVSDAIAEFLAGHVRHVFTISGGADLHIIDSIAKRADIRIICPQNEQAASFQADAYARLTGMGCALVTSGPGATNLLTGIAASFYDSIPVLYLTGNQTRDRCENYGTRQYGFQATPIVEMARPVTKWAVQIKQPEMVLPILADAIKMARTARRGPVLVDIPDDIQRAQI